MPIKGILQDPADNVVTTVAAAPVGSEIIWGTEEQERVIAVNHVPAYHKVAVAKICSGDAVKKYGHCIAIASKDIQPGEHVHVHNCSSMVRGEQV